VKEDESAAHKVRGYKLFRLLANSVTIRNSESHWWSSPTTTCDLR